jgi:hypothetical protein
LLSLLLMIAACADEGDDRQFANHEETTDVPATTQPALPPTPLTDVSPPVAATPFALGAFVEPRGGARSIAIATDQQVYLFEGDSEDVRLLWESDQEQVWHAERSSSQEQTAILLSPTRSVTSWRVVVVDDDGEVVGDVQILRDSATPGADADAVAMGTGGLAWSPEGASVAVALPTGGLFEIINGSEVQTMVPPQRAARPGALGWSPDGRALAFVNRPSDRTGSGVYLAPTGANPLDPVTLLVPDSTGNRTVGDLGWLPSGDALMLVIYRQPAPNAIGDIFRVAVRDSTPQLFASGIDVSNRASIEYFDVSTDGQILAYAVRAEEREDASWFLFLDQIAGPGLIQAEVGTGGRVTSVQWSERGPIVSVSQEYEEGRGLPITLLGIDDEGRLDPVASIETPVDATPAASPAAATPDASPIPLAVEEPVGSPVASPAASPQASPQATPVAVAD